MAGLRSGDSDALGDEANGTGVSGNDIGVGVGVVIDVMGVGVGIIGLGLEPRYRSLATCHNTVRQITSKEIILNPCVITAFRYP